MAKDEGFVLGVDLDGVCADFYGALRPIVGEWLGVPVDELSPDEFTYGVPEWGVRDLEHYKRIHRHAVTQREFFSAIEPIQGAAPALRRLSDEGVHVRVITHRLFIAHFHQEAVRQTVEWLDRHGIPYWDLCFLKEKVEVGADLYIEDTPDNIRTLQEAQKPVIVFTNPTNRDLEGVLRADTWEDVERIVQEKIKQSGKTLKPPKGPQGPANDPQVTISVNP